MASNDLSRLIKKARGTKMTATEREEQRRSFAFGNANIENARVSRKMIDAAAEKSSDVDG